MLRKKFGYAHATAFVPAWINARTRTMYGSSCRPQSAATLFLGDSPGGPPVERPTVPGATVPWNCMSKLLTSVCTPFHPAYTGEGESAQSVCDSRQDMFDEIATHAMLGMLASFFRSVDAGKHRFFRAPPYSFAVATVAQVGYIVAVEWVDKLLVSAASEPFFLGSQAHAAAGRRLPDCDMSGDVCDLSFGPDAVAVWPPEPEARACVIWRVAAQDGAAEAPPPPFFFKIVRGGGFAAPFFRRLYTAYAALAAARADVSDPPPPAIAAAELLFGAGEVCVRMEWVRGREATAEDLGEGGCALRPLATALAWLARHRMLYVDVREPNVLIDDGGDGEPRVVLVDYDDMVVVEEPPCGADELCALLAKHGAAFVALEGTPGARPALVAALREAWPSSRW